MKKRLLIILFISLLFLIPNKTKAVEIKNNGLGGINIDIEAMPQSHNNLKYQTSGCTWFVGGRILQLTGKANWVDKNKTTIYVYGSSGWMRGYNQIGPRGTEFGTGSGTIPIAPSVIVYENHVAILEKIEGETAYISEGGVRSAGSTYGHTWIRSVKLSAIPTLNSGFRGYVYLTPQWYSSYKLNDLGNVYYGSLNINKNWVKVIDDGTKPVLGAAKSGNYNYIWAFRKQADGSYTIQNAATKRYIEIDNYNDVDGGVVKTTDKYTGNTNQRFYIYGRWSGEYLLRPASSQERVLNVNGNNEIGDLINIWEHNDGDQQRFGVYKYNGASEATLDYSLSNKETTLTWNQTEYTKSYDIEIKTGSKTNLTNYKTITDLTDTNYKISLPTGYYQVTIISKNEFSETPSNTIKFNIIEDQDPDETPIPTVIIGCDITTEQDEYKYTGQPIVPEVTVIDGTRLLTEGEDYTTVYKANTDVGTGYVEITGMGYYTGTYTHYFEIVKADYDISKITFNTTSLTYDGKAHSISATNLPAGVTVTYQNNNKTDVGTYTVTATFTGDYKNYNEIPAKKATLKINQKALSKTTITGLTDKIYTGSNINQNVVVKDGSKELVNNKDYTISYKNNKNVGTAYIILTGKGNYVGTVTKTFKINPKKTTLKSLTKGTKSFKAKWTKITTQTTGYEIQYSTSKTFASNNKTVTITNNKTYYKTIKSLKAKKKYYVRVRTYKNNSGNKYYSEWSNVKYITTK